MFDSGVKFDASHSMGGRVLISVTENISLTLWYKAKSERLGKSLSYQGPEMMHYSVTSVFAVPLISLRAVRLSFSLFSIFNIFPKHFLTCAVVLLLDLTPFVSKNEKIENIPPLSLPSQLFYLQKLSVLNFIFAIFIILS